MAKETSGHGILERKSPLTEGDFTYCGLEGERLEVRGEERGWWSWKGGQHVSDLPYGPRGTLPLYY